METQPDLLTDLEPKQDLRSRRRSIPLFMKIFMWIFLVLGGVVPLVAIIGISSEVSLALYGFGTTQAYSLIGLLLMGVYLVKGIVSVGLFTGKDWAPKLAILDGVLGIVLCIANMLIGGGGLRIELLLLIPYVYYSNRLLQLWRKTIPYSNS